MAPPLDFDLMVDAVGGSHHPSHGTGDLHHEGPGRLPGRLPGTEAVQVLKEVHHLLSGFFSENSNHSSPPVDASHQNFAADFRDDESMSSDVSMNDHPARTTESERQNSCDSENMSISDGAGHLQHKFTEGNHDYHANLTLAPRPSSDHSRQILHKNMMAGGVAEEMASTANRDSRGDVNTTSEKQQTASDGAVPAGNRGKVAPVSLDHLKSVSDEIRKNIDGAATGEEARLKVLKPALELLGAIRPGPDTIMGWFANLSIVSVVRVFSHWRVFDLIPAEPGSSISYADLAAKVNADEALLVRLSWLLTSTATLQHVEPDRIAHTPTSLLLRENQPFGSMFKVLYTNVLEVSTILPNYFDTYGRKEPLGPNHIPTSFLAGKPEMEYFELMSQNPAQTKNFMRAMSLILMMVPTTGMYDMEWVLSKADQEPDRLIWVDVGGGSGHSLKLFREKYPGLRARQTMVQDLPEVIKAAQQVAKNDELLKGVQWAPLNFHKEAPVKGKLPTLFLSERHTSFLRCKS